MTSKNKWHSRTRQARDKVEDNVGDQLTNMASDIVKLAQENANARPPAHPQVQSGTMWRSITMDVDRRKLTAKVGIMQGTKDGDEALVYAPFVEFGTARHPPYPFLFPAAEFITKRAKRYFK